MSSLQAFARLLFTFHRRHSAQAAITWLVLVVITAPVFMFSKGLGSWTAYYMSTILLLAAAGFVFNEVMRYEQSLLARIQHHDGIRICEVRVNQVAIGAIDDADYATVQHRVFSDYRIWVAQVASYFALVFRLITRFVRLIPMVAFWSVVATYVFQHDVLVELVQTATAEELVSALPSAMTGLIIVSALVLGLQSFFDGGQSFDLNSVYQRACASDVRKAIGCPADGDIAVTPTFAETVPMQIALGQG